MVAGECENGTSPRSNIKTEDESLREAVMKSSERSVVWGLYKAVKRQLIL